MGDEGGPVLVLGLSLAAACLHFILPSPHKLDPQRGGELGGALQLHPTQMPLLLLVLR